jgi:hypothetical protein
MHYMTHISYRMHKHKFGVTCPVVVCVESVPVPPEHEKLHVDDSRLRRNRMHYMTRRSHQMQKHKFGLTCPAALFVESEPVPPENDK